MTARRALLRGLLLIRLASRLRLGARLLGLPPRPPTTGTPSSRGECSRNVRSTPMPWATRRTVKLELTPPRRLRMTTPSNACPRSRSPSTTRAMTRTVSPGRKSGTFGFCLSGTIDFRSMATFPGLLFALPKGKPLPLLRGQLHAHQEVRPSTRRQKQVLPPPPLRHLLVISGGQPLRHRPGAGGRGRES